MTKEPTIRERFFAETPVFFQRVQFVCFMLQCAFNLLTTVGLFKDHISDINAIIMVAIVISQFAIKDIGLIQNSPDPADAVTKLIPELVEQKEAIIKILHPVIDEYPETPVDKPQAA